MTLWLTRSSPTVSNRPASSATSTLVPTPSVLSTSTGFCMPAGTRTMPPNAPTSPTESAVRVPATSWPIRSLAASARARSTPGRGVLARGHATGSASSTWVRSPERARPGARTCASVTPSKPLDAELRHGERAHRRRRTPSRAGGSASLDRAAPREVAHEPAGEGVARAGRIEDLLQREGRHVEGAARRSISSAPYSPCLITTRLGPCAQDPAAGAVDVPVARELPRLAVVDHQDVHPLQQLEQRVAACSGSSSSSCRTPPAAASAPGRARRAAARDRCCRGRRTRRRRNVGRQLAAGSAAKTPRRVSSVSRLCRS